MSSLYPRDLPLAASHSDYTGLPDYSPKIRSSVAQRPGLTGTLVAAAPIDPNEWSGEGEFHGLCRLTLPSGSTTVFELRCSVDWRTGVAHLSGLPVESNRQLGAGDSDRTGDTSAQLGDRKTPPLTKREREVAELLARGESNARIAEQLEISPHTARRHTESVMLKLGVNARAQVGAVLRGAWPPPLRIAG